MRGRTAANNALNLIGERFDASPSPAATRITAPIGRSLWRRHSGAVTVRVTDREGAARAAGRAAESRGPSEREGIGALVSLEPTLSREPSDGPSEREVLARSSIELALADGSGGWSVWGRAGIAGFKGREGDLSLDGDVLSGHIGIDYAWEHLLTGLAVSRNEGEGGFRGLANGAGEATATLTSVHPYARLSSREGLTVWAIAGFGWGDMELEDKAGRVETDIKMRMAALGGRQELMSLGKAALAAKADAFAMWIESAGVPGLTAVDVNAQRLRLALEGSYDHALASGARLTPTLELGVRHDAGDAETGAGMETGGRLRFSDPSLGLTVEGSGRVLLTHRERGYDDWGVGGALRLSPGAAGRGLSIQLAPSYGQASRGVDRLWTGGASGRGDRLWSRRARRAWSGHALCRSDADRRGLAKLAPGQSSGDRPGDLSVPGGRAPRKRDRSSRARRAAGLAVALVGTLGAPR